MPKIKILIVTIFVFLPSLLLAQESRSILEPSDLGQHLQPTREQPPETELQSNAIQIDLSNKNPGQANDAQTASPQRGFNIGGTNGVQFGGGKGYRIGPSRAGVQYGGGKGVRYGTERAGVQYGAGQGARFGTERFGVQYGGGEGARFGSKNIGVQYGGGQILRWGTPNAGVKIGGGEGFRIGTRNKGIQFGTGRGLQVGIILPPVGQ